MVASVDPATGAERILYVTCELLFACAPLAQDNHPIVLVKHGSKLDRAVSCLNFKSLSRLAGSDWLWSTPYDVGIAVNKLSPE